MLKMHPSSEILRKAWRRFAISAKIVSYVKRKKREYMASEEIGD